MLYYLKITIDESKILINFKKKGSEMSQKFNYFGFKAIMQYALKSAYGLYTCI